MVPSQGIDNSMNTSRLLLPASPPLETLRLQASNDVSKRTSTGIEILAAGHLNVGVLIDTLHLYEVPLSSSTIRGINGVIVTQLHVVLTPQIFEGAFISPVLLPRHHVYMDTTHLAVLGPTNSLP